MHYLIAIIANWGISCLKWALIDFPRMVIKLWAYIIKKVWGYLPLVAIALGIVMAELVLIIASSLIFSGNTTISGYIDKILYYQLSPGMMGFASSLMNKFMGFFADPPLKNGYSTVIAIIIGTALLLCSIGALIFISMVALILMSWKVLLTALIINLIIIFAKRIASSHHRQENTSISDDVIPAMENSGNFLEDQLHNQ